jgi:HSP20 family protein
MANIWGREEWDSREELSQMQRERDRLAQGAFRSVGSQGVRLFPSIIVSATDEALLVRAEVPGMDLKDLGMSVSGDTLTIDGYRITGKGLEGGWYHRRERESGGFSRAVRLPADVDGDGAEATYVAGVLTISLPLRQSARPKAIPVHIAEG